MSVIALYQGGSAVVTSKDANVTAGNLTNASLSLFNTNSTAGYGSDPILQCNPPASTTTVAQAVTNSAYYSFVITPGGGKVMNLTSLTFNAARGGSSTPRGWAVRTSIDSYAADAGTSTCASQRTTFTGYTVDLSGASFQGLSAAITFRVYLYAPTSVSVDMDDVTLNGTVTDAGGATRPPNPKLLGGIPFLTINQGIF